MINNLKNRFNQQKDKLQDNLDKKPLYRKILDEVQAFNKMDFGNVAAASSFYFIFSLFPLILFFISLINLIDPNMAGQIEELMPDLSLIVPEPILTLLKEFVHSADFSRSIPLLSISALGSLWAAGRGVGNIVNSLNRIYQSRNHSNFLILRFFGIIGILFLSVVLAGIIIVISFNRLVINYLSQFLKIPDFLTLEHFNTTTYLLALTILVFIFMLIFQVLSRNKSKIRYSFVAGLISALGWMIISQFLQHFLQTSSTFNTRYGSISVIIMLLLWIYIAIYIIMIGSYIHKWLMDKDKSDSHIEQNDK